MYEPAARPSDRLGEQNCLVERLEAVRGWPDLKALRLSDEAVRERSRGIGGSDANVILSGNRDRLVGLWREKRGEQAPEDLCDRLPVMLGCWTEPFNRQWYEQLTGHRVREVGFHTSCSEHSWRQCTLDGFVEEIGSIWEAKHTGSFSKPEDVLERYMPQLQHNMAVRKCERAVLSVIFGNHRFEIFEVASDWLYQLELFEAEATFWDCVLTGREPVPARPPSAPKPIGVREVCLQANNSWAAAAADWLENREAAKLHASACKTIKELVEDDVARAFGHGIEAKRSKSGAISIRDFAL
jgi:predicted phage-related endonuclease